VLAALVALLSDELAVLLQVTAAARDEATSPESRAENKYDTRATEASYLAAGQGERLVTLRHLLAWAESGTGALVQVDPPAWFLLAPDGGGRVVRVSGVEVRVVTPGSPVGEALAAAAPGDVVRIGPREVEVVAVS
jgi:transcription elongation GreA/GreB family factor